MKAKDKSIKSAPYNNLSEVEHVRMYVNSKELFALKKKKPSHATSALIEKDGKQVCTTTDLSLEYLLTSI